MDDMGARNSGFEPESINIGSEIAAAAEAATRLGAVPLLANADNMVVLPAGATLDDIRVDGRDLVIRLDDGRVFVIPDGAVFVPQIVVDGVAVPPLNLAALLIGDQPQPAAGAVSSSGGNFADPAGPIQSAFDLGNLLPYTELAFPDQPDEEVIPPRLNNLPTTIIITPNNPAGAVSATATVNEKGLPIHGSLPAGSGEIADGIANNNSDTTETTTGTIDITSLDGVRSVSLNGVLVTAVGQTIVGASGTLTITSIDLVNQTIGYSYTLTNSTLGDNTTDIFAVSVVDNDGDVASATLTVNIIDDVPTARPDSNSVAEGATVTGEVLPNDTPGADGYVTSGGVVGVRAAGSDTTTAVTTGVGTTINGLYGTLTLNANGTYSYKSTANAITANQQDVFVYTIRDGDSDQSTTTLTINLANVTLAADNQAKTVNEAALDTAITNPDLGAGSVIGSNPTSPAETVTGQLAVAGASSYTAQSVTTAYGLFRLNADGSYTYTLTNQFDTTPDVNNGAHTQNAVETFTYSALDSNGNTVSGTITINVIDDVPTARNDTDAITNGGTTTTGNVITGVDTTSGAAGVDTLGADGAAVSGVRAGTVAGAFASPGATVAGQFGTLVLGTNGNYTYTRTDNRGGGIDVFTYQVTDGDGDTTTATLTITITDLIPTAGSVSVTLDDDTKANGNPGGTGDDTPDTSNTSGTLPASGGDGALTLAFSGAGAPAGFTYDTSVANTLLIKQGGTTVVTVTLNPATGAYTVTQNAPILHDTLNGIAGDNTENNQTFSITYTVTDADGDAVNGTIAISVDDDTPDARDDTDTVTSGTVTTDGNVISGVGTTSSPGGIDGAGADGGGAITGLVSVNMPLNSDNDAAGGFSVVGQYGTLVMQTGGGYVYTRNAGTPGGVVDSFTYTLTDADGDTDTAVLAITIVNSNPAGGTASVTLDDDDVNANGIAGGTGDLAAVLPAGPLPDPSQGDAPLTYSFAAPGAAPTGFSYDTATAGQVKIFQGATLVVTVTFNATTGVYSVVQNAPILHAAETGGALDDTENNQVFSLAYTVKDADLQTANGTLTITVNDDTPTATASTAATPTLVLDESAAGTDTTGGGTPTGRNSITANFTNNFVTPTKYGADGPGNVAYALLLSANGIGSGLFALDPADVSASDGDGLGKGAEITLSQTGNTITGSVGANNYFTISIDAVTGVVTFAQSRNIWHANAGSSTAALDDTAVLTTLAASSIQVQQSVTDADGDTAKATINVGQNVFSIQDDGPSFFGTGVQSQQTNNNPATASAVGTLHFAPGTDGAGVATITANLANITVGNQSLTGSQIGNVFYAYVENGTTAGYQVGETVAFTLTVNPTAGTSGQYVFDLVTPLDPTVTDVPIGSGSSFGVGPSNSVIVGDTATATSLAYVTGWAPNPGPTFGAAAEAAWFLGGNPTLTQTSNVNGSTAGFGLGNNNLDDGEFMRFDFGALDDYDGAGGYAVPGGTGPFPNVTYATFTFANYEAGDIIKFVAHYTNGTTASFTSTGGVDGASRTISAPSGTNIAWVDVYESTGSIKLNLTALGVASTSIDKTIPFTLVMTDSDGDQTALQNFTVRVANTVVAPDAPVAPIVIDLTGNGLHFQSLAAGIYFDYAGTGQQLSTAWAGKDDGILAIDLNGDGKIDSGKEFVFGGNGQTDLQGLAAKYDSNHDGVLDAKDAEFAKFGVWQDADSDGVNDAGEFRSLTDLGIASINLTSDGKAYAAADGDVTVHGETVFTWSDGSTGVAADASFAVSSVTGSASSASSPAGDTMSALLGLAAAAPVSADPAQEQNDFSSIVQALGDSSSSNFIDNLVNSLAGGGSGASLTGDGDTDALAGLLAAQVGPTGEMAHLPFDMGHLDSPVDALVAG